MLRGSASAASRDRVFALAEDPQQRYLTEWADQSNKRRAEWEDKRARRRAEFAARIPAIAAQVASEVSAAVAAALRVARAGHHQDLDMAPTTTTASVISERATSIQMSAAAHSIPTSTGAASASHDSDFALVAPTTCSTECFDIAAIAKMLAPMGTMDKSATLTIVRLEDTKPTSISPDVSVFVCPNPVMSTAAGPRRVTAQPMLSGVLDIDIIGIDGIIKLDIATSYKADEVLSTATTNFDHLVDELRPLPWPSFECSQGISVQESIRGSIYTRMPRFYPCYVACWEVLLCFAMRCDIAVFNCKHLVHPAVGVHTHVDVVTLTSANAIVEASPCLLSMVDTNSQGIADQRRPPWPPPELEILHTLGVRCLQPTNAHFEVPPCPEQCTSGNSTQVMVAGSLLQRLSCSSAPKVLMEIFSEAMSSWSYPIPSAKPGMLMRYNLLYASHSLGTGLLHDGYIQVWVSFLLAGQLIQFAFKLYQWKIAWILDWDCYENASVNFMLTNMGEEILLAHSTVIYYCIGGVTARYAFPEAANFLETSLWVLTVMQPTYANGPLMFRKTIEGPLILHYPGTWREKLYNGLIWQCCITSASAPQYGFDSFPWYIAWLLVELSCAHSDFGGTQSPEDALKFQLAGFLTLAAQPPNCYDTCCILLNRHSEIIDLLLGVLLVQPYSVMVQQMSDQHDPRPSVDQMLLQRYTSVYAWTCFAVGLLHDPLLQEWLLSWSLGHIIHCGFVLLPWKIACSLNWGCSENTCMNFKQLLRLPNVGEEIFQANFIVFCYSVDRVAAWYVRCARFRPTEACFLLDDMQHTNSKEAFPTLILALPEVPAVIGVQLQSHLGTTMKEIWSGHFIKLLKGSKHDNSFCELSLFLLSMLLPIQKVQLCCYCAVVVAACCMWATRFRSADAYLSELHKVQCIDVCFSPGAAIAFLHICQGHIWVTTMLEFVEFQGTLLADCILVGSSGFAAINGYIHVHATDCVALLSSKETMDQWWVFHYQSKLQEVFRLTEQYHSFPSINYNIFKMLQLQWNLGICSASALRHACWRLGLDTPQVRWDPGASTRHRACHSSGHFLRASPVGHKYYFDFHQVRVDNDCYLDGASFNLASIHLDHGLYHYVYHHVSDELKKSQVPWDPGGSARCRLGVKPKFKKGGLSATSSSATGLDSGPPILGLGCSKTTSTSTTNTRRWQPRKGTWMERLRPVAWLGQRWLLSSLLSLYCSSPSSVPLPRHH